MRIESVLLREFRCFGPDGQAIELDDLNAFVGPNASGKTAAMLGLARVFGESQDQRSVTSSDFHLGRGEALKEKSQRSLSIDCRLTFPELDQEDTRGSAGVPEVFNQMVVDEPGGSPYCRIRLEATWTNDGTVAGHIDQDVSWILTSSDDPEVIDDGNKPKLGPGQRAGIRVIYVPAAREPGQQIRATTATAFGRLLDSLAWGDSAEHVENSLMELEATLGGLVGIQTMSDYLQGAWSELYDGRIARELSLNSVEGEAAALVKALVPTFRPGEDGRRMTSAELSDGHRSLFSLALSLGLFAVEEKLRETPASSGFVDEVAERLPSLTLFAIEEPENHLSPQYLGKVVAQLKALARHDRAQVVLSSHSPSILSRIQPEDVRYFLGHEHTPSSKVLRIPLPTDEADEAFKYVREAVLRHPELYFARLVILGEGASEEIILHRLFEARGHPLDTQFISVAPLGGRHVNHFWRLLHGLGIPYITILDLDRERHGGGWGRIQYIRDELLKLEASIRWWVPVVPGGVNLVRSRTS